MFKYKFSDELNVVIKLSREIALDLGYNYVSTIHIFLADCTLNQIWTIKWFIFKEQVDFLKFYEELRISDPIINHLHSLPLTKEAEQAVRRAAFECYLLSERILLPQHILLAAAKNKKSVLYQLFQQELLYSNLLNYYLNYKIIRPATKQGAVNKLFQKFLFYLLN